MHFHLPTSSPVDPFHQHRKICPQLGTSRDVSLSGSKTQKSLATTENGTRRVPSTAVAASSKRATATPGITIVILSVELAAQQVPDGNRKRGLYLWARDEASGFVGDENYYNPDSCTDATRFHQGNGQLISRKRPISVDPGVDFINISDYPVGSISTSTCLKPFFSTISQHLKR
jgi:hypothetical protein